VFVWQSARHPAPIIEPELLRVRAFAAANVAGVLFFIGFAAMLLGSVLFLTEVWHQSVLAAGLKIAPGPAAAALFAVPGGILGHRIGPRAVGVAGTLLFALGGVFWATRVGTEVHYAADFLPGMLISGAGVGLVNPSLAGAATAQLPPARLATGSAILTMSRQLGSALGVALFVAVLGTPGPADALAAFDDVWWMMVGAALASSLAFALVGPIAARASVPAAVPATEAAA
jgi:MFS family permease